MYCFACTRGRGKERGEKKVDYIKLWCWKKMTGGVDFQSFTSTQGTSLGPEKKMAGKKGKEKKRKEGTSLCSGCNTQGARHHGRERGGVGVCIKRTVSSSSAPA